MLMIVDVSAQQESLETIVRQSYPAQQVPMELLARIVVLLAEPSVLMIVDVAAPLES